jgi:hypothetical protein
VKKTVTVASILIVLLAATAFQSPVLGGEEKKDSIFVIQITRTLSNPISGTQIWNLTAEERTINLFMNNTWQTVQLINSSVPLEKRTTDENGNPIAFLQLPQSELKPGEDVSYFVTYRALSRPRSLPNIAEIKSETLEEIPAELKANYTGTGGPWLVNDKELQALAHNITESETRVLTIIKRLLTWIRDNIKYKTHGLLPYYPDETYAKREGDCDDQANLFITLCRICGIPSFLQMGCIYMPTEHINQTFWEGHVTLEYEKIGWHGWAVVYVPPWGWLPVDLTYVIGGLSDPLNAIRQAAVVSLQEVIQYMNTTKTDYVASYNETRNFLQDNNFYIYERNEITQQETPEDVGGEILSIRLKLALVATVLATIAAFGLLYAQKLKKRVAQSTKPIAE